MLMCFADKSAGVAQRGRLGSRKDSLGVKSPNEAIYHELSGSPATICNMGESTRTWMARRNDGSDIPKKT